MVTLYTGKKAALFFYVLMCAFEKIATATNLRKFCATLRWPPYLQFASYANPNYIQL